MKFLLFLLLSSGVVFSTGSLAHARTEIWSICSYSLTPAAKPLGHFELKKFLAELDSTLLYDNNGLPFKFHGSSNRLGDLWHSKYGEVDSSGIWGGDFEGALINSKGNLEWSDAMIVYPEDLRGKGFMNALFVFMRDRLPEGSTMILEDATHTGLFFEELIRMTDSEFEVFLEKNSHLKALYHFFKKISALPTFDRLYVPTYSSFHTLVPRSHRVYTPFIRYLYDVGSQWGRIARKGNFRGDYFSPYLTIYTQLIKRDIPKEVYDEEDAVLKSIPENFFRTALPWPDFRSLSNQ